MSVVVKSLHARVFFIVALALGLTSCVGPSRTALYRTPYPWQRESTDPQSVMTSDSPSLVRITTAEGTRFVLEDARLAEKAIAGTAYREDDSAPDFDFVVAIDDISKIEWRKQSRSYSWIQLPIIAGVVFFGSRALQALLFGSG